MALAYLLDPFLQYQNRAGVNNVAGYLEVFRMDTDDRATVYTDFNGTLAPAHIGIDNDGYAVMIVESGIPYRVEIHGPNGDLFRTWQPVWPVASGGGVSGTDIISTDGSIAIDKSTVGSVATYDLSSHVEDSTDLLEWIKTEGYTQPADDMIPTYQAGTMEVGGNGVILYAGRYYHVTARVRAVVGSLNPYYNEFDIIVRGFDGEGYTTYLDRPVVIDGSTGTTQEWEVSLDIMPDTDVQLSVSTSGLDTYNNSVGLLDMEIHRVYSGAPYIPGGVASRPWVEENYQEKLTPGNGIEIDENNVISATAAQQQQADWAQTDTEAVDYIKNKPANLVQDADYVHTDNNFTDSDKSKLTGIESGAEVNVQANWNESDSSSDAYIQNKPANLVQDANYVHTDNNFTNDDVTKLSGIAAGAEVNVQPNWNETDTSSDAYIANKPANLVQDASYVHTDNNFTNADVSKLSGIASGAEVNVQANWNETDTSSDAYIQNKPSNLVQDASYVHTDNNFTNADATKLSGIASGAEVNVQANWNESDSSSDAYIQNKPTIPSGSQLVPSATPSDAGEVLTVDQNGDPTWAAAQAPISAGNGIDITSNTVSAKVDGSTITFNASGEMVASGGSVPPLKPVVAGPNITITENSSDIAISAVIPVVPVIGTITL